MKKRIAFMLVILMLASTFTACAGNGAAPSGDTKTDTNKPAEVTKYAGMGYDSTTNPKVVAYTSEPPEGLSVTSVPDTLTVGNAGEPVNLYPYTANQIPALIAINPIYETLVKYNTFTNEYDPNLAESWEWIDDQTLRMHLRKDVVCHAGYDFTASDVLWSAQQGVASSISNYLWSVFDIENFKIIDDYTIDICTFGPFGPIFAYLSDTSTGYIVDQQAYEKQTPEDYARNPTGGYGPYQFVEWVAGDHITYKLFDKYYGDKPYFKNLVIRNIADDVTRALSIEAGELDMIYTVDTSSAKMLIDSPTVNLITCPSYQLIHLGYNMKKKPFDNPLVRKALRYALDLDSMVNLAFLGMATVADGPWPNSLTAYKQNSNPDTAYKYDVKKAKELLAEAGYPNGFKFDLWVADTTAWMQMAEMIQNAYAEIGVTANVQVMDQNTLLAQRAEGKHEAYIARFSCSGDDAAFWKSRFYSGGSYQASPSQYSNPRVDELIDKAAASRDTEFRLKCYYEVVDIFREDLVFQPLACPMMCYAVRSTLKGVAPHPYGTSDLRYIRPITVD